MAALLGAPGDASDDLMLDVLQHCSTSPLLSGRLFAGMSAAKELRYLALKTEEGWHKIPIRILEWDTTLPEGAFSRTLPEDPPDWTISPRTDEPPAQ